MRSSKRQAEGRTLFGPPSRLFIINRTLTGVCKQDFTPRPPRFLSFPFFFFWAATDRWMRRQRRTCLG
ncbi:uncharacterized protein BDCG_17016 [Blastomyces dermatitidis ER-3]|uniref:Uncharacterized protein n=1 Tax=Ajellomyces dermatitidis (strain ER-3 / ATCC MYA-2586) TaxID=559297 RepID=A0ABP2EZD6_AJEDR|nr:uncharacterized protein BDCG_17016 [Blastomyces dermatitidis ER-3]EEQ89682.2 hypothetical protein BDCG_17016 [Blastomyces dermatitidis ER-3]